MAGLPRIVDEVFPLRGAPLWGAEVRIGFVIDSGSITRILGYLGEPTQAPRIAPPARGPAGRRTSIRAKAICSP